MRVSRDREGGISADQQRNEIEHWAAAPGKEREIVWLPPDTDWSGKSLQRPSIQKALELLRAGQVDGLVVSKLDRLTRSVADLNGLIKEAQAEGWNLVGLDIGVDLLSTNGKMVAQLIGTISEWYLDRVTEEWEKVRRYKIEGKGAHWGAPPLGYKRGRTTNDRGQESPGALVVDEHWAPLVHEVFRRRAARKSDGTWAKLAQYLSAEGAPNYLARAQAEKEGRPPAGTKWSAAGVKSIIANRAYLGEARSGSLIKRKAHPALVDEETWLVANRKGPTYGSLADRKDGPLLGGGLLRCGTCGGGLVRSSGRNRRGRRYEYYRCPAPTCKLRTAIMAHRIEQYLIGKAFQRLDDEHSLHTRLPEIRSALFREIEGCEVSTSGRVAARLVPRDVGSARSFLRDVLGSVIVHPVKHLVTQQPIGRLYALDGRVCINWPSEAPARIEWRPSLP